jgi:hypothetical protein
MIALPHALGALMLVTCTLAACGGDAERVTVDGAGQTLFPEESTRDWVSYADHVAVYTVVSERAVENELDQQRGEGAVGRVVRLRIDRVLWSSKGAPDLPREVEMNALGWALQAGKRIPFVSHEGPRVEVGERYVAPLVQVEFDDGPIWWTLTMGSQMPLDGAVVQKAEWHSPVNQQLAGLAIEDVATHVREQKPDPIAAANFDKRPQDRVEIVQRSREPG